MHSRMEDFMRIVMPSVPHHQFRSHIDLQPAHRCSVAKHLIRGGLAGYEPETVAAALALVEEEGVIEAFDIGANIGFYAVVLKAVFGDAISIAAFEPTPTLHDRAVAVAERNGTAIAFHQM